MAVKRIRRVPIRPPYRKVSVDDWVDVEAVEQVGRYGPGDSFKVRAADLGHLPVKAPNGVRYEVEDADGTR